MARLLQLTLFLLVAIGVTFGLHAYFWARLVRSPALPPPWRLIGTLLFALLAAAIPLTAVLARFLPRDLGRALIEPIYGWMGVMLLLFAFLLAGEAVRLLLALVDGVRALATAPDPPLVSRLLLARALALVAVLATVGATAAGLVGGRAPVAVREVEVKLPRLPRALDGLVVAQITDIHLGPTLGREIVDEVVAKTNGLHPDVIVITGDLADATPAALADAVAPLAELRARHGVYFVTGNHEYYAGAPAWVDALPRLGVRVLRNERVSIGEGDASFDLVGVDDYSARGHAPGHGPDLARALAGHDPARASLLLAHQPRQVAEAARLGVGLMLSGHTHGGQIWPFGYLVTLQQPFVVGLHRVGDTQVYVSPGTGHWGPRMRLGTRAEITKIVLRAPR